MFIGSVCCRFDEKRQCQHVRRATGRNPSGRVPVAQIPEFLLGEILQECPSLPLHFLRPVISHPVDDAGIVQGGHDPQQGQDFPIPFQTAGTVKGQPVFIEGPVSAPGHLHGALDAGIPPSGGTVIQDSGRFWNRMRIQRQAQGEDGAAVGVHPAGGGEHGLFRVQAEPAELRRSVGEGHAREEGPDGRHPLPHEVIIHVPVRPRAVGAHETRLHKSIQFQEESPPGEVGQKVWTGRCGGEGRCSPEAAGREAGADPGGADSAFGVTQPRHFDHLHPISRKHFLHQGIVTGGQGVRGLTAHETHPGAERRRDMPAEQVDVQTHLRLGRIGKIFQEIGREGRRRYLVITSFHDIGQSAAPLPDHLEPLLIREEGYILLDGNDDEVSRFRSPGPEVRGSLLHQVFVSQGEWIGVHHDDTFRGMKSKSPAVLLQSPSVLQEDRLGGFGEHPEAQALENLMVLRFGENLQVHETTLGGAGNEAGDERDGEAGGTGGLRDGDAFDKFAGQSAAGQDGTVIGEDRHIQIDLLEPETVSPEEVLHLTADRRNAQRQLLYVDTIEWFHHPAGFPILPVPPQIDITERR